MLSSAAVPVASSSVFVASVAPSGTETVLTPAAFYEVVGGFIPQTLKDGNLTDANRSKIEGTIKLWLDEIVKGKTKTILNLIENDAILKSELMNVFLKAVVKNYTDHYVPTPLIPLPSSAATQPSNWADLVDEPVAASIATDNTTVAQSKVDKSTNNASWEFGCVRVVQAGEDIKTFAPTCISAVHKWYFPRESFPISGPLVKNKGKVTFSGVTTNWFTDNNGWYWQGGKLQGGRHTSFCYNLQERSWCLKRVEVKDGKRKQFADLSTKFQVLDSADDAEFAKMVYQICSFNIKNRNDFEARRAKIINYLITNKGLKEDMFSNTWDCQWNEPAKKGVTTDGKSDKVAESAVQSTESD